MRLRSSTRAFEEFSRLGTMLSGTMDVLRDLKDIESMQLMADAAEKRKADAEKALNAAQASLVQAQSEGAAATEKITREQVQRIADANKSVGDAQTRVQALQAEAEAEAARTKAVATTEAEAMVQAAKDKAQQTVDGIAAEQARLEALQADCTAAEEKLATITTEVGKIEKRRASLLQSLSS